MVESTLLGLLSCWMAFTIAAFVPGPNSVAVISVALGSGRQSGLCVALGIAIGAFFWALVTAYGLAKMFTVYPNLIASFAFLGGSYLCCLGIKALISTVRAPSSVDHFITHSIKHSVLHGLFVTATNPKAALFWLSLSTLISTLSGHWIVIIVFAIVTSILAFLVYGGYAIAFSIKKFRDWYGKKQACFLLIFAGYFFIVGLMMILMLGLG